MKVSEAWLREWVNPSLTTPQWADQLTMLGLEVDNIHPVAGDFTHVIVAHVLAVSRHPQADKLSLCRVDAGFETPLSIVCGASNVRANLRVALALPGAHLPGDLVIKESMLRGELSQGMLCSSTELGFDDGSDGIMELPQDAPIGMDVREYFQFNDHVFELSVTPNRADCFSVYGVARDVAAAQNLPILPLSTVLQDEKALAAASMKVNLQAPQACPHYCLRVIRGLNPQACTPLWMKERLRRAGIRSVHPIVDVTNYVMMECGQPLHAFDLQAVHGDLQVCFADAQACLTLLNDQKVVLQTDVLIIRDEKKPLAMAGIMGGLESAVNAQTSDVVLESAYFNPANIRGVARRYGLCTDASQRFERGVDPQLQRYALQRATDLIVSIAGGQVEALYECSIDSSRPQGQTIVFLPEHVKRLTGLDVPQEQMQRILEQLGLHVDCQADAWHVQVPSHRFDLSASADLVEEIVRIVGYAQIPSSTPICPLSSMPMNQAQLLQTRLGEYFSDNGYREIISYSFVDPAFQQTLYPDANMMALMNPLSTELSVMRVGLWPGLLASMIHNLHRQQTVMKLFECGVVFEKKDGTIHERACVAGLITGTQGAINWCETPRVLDFFDAKGDLEGLWQRLHKTSVTFVADEHPALHPGKSARLVDGQQSIGWIGVLHPRIQDAFDLTEDVVLFEMDCAALQQPARTVYQKISKYPHMRRDLSLLVPMNVTVAQITHAIESIALMDCLQSMSLFDVYIGDSIPDTHKSMAIAFVFQREERTLIDQEINQLIDAILQRLHEDFSITLRFDPMDSINSI